MKIAKALKLKKRIAGEVAKLNALLQQNVVQSGVKQNYDVVKVWAELAEKVDRLALVKAGVAVANAGGAATDSSLVRGTAAFKIFLMAEKKGLISALMEIPTRDEVVRMPQGMGQPPREVTYSSQMGRNAIDAEAARLQAEVEALQDELDEFNATRSVLDLP